MSEDFKDLLLENLGRLEKSLDRLREKQDQLGVQASSIQTRVDAEDDKITSLGESLKTIYSTVGRLKVDMAVAQAKAGGIAGLLGGGLATVIVKVIELLVGSPG